MDDTSPLPEPLQQVLAVCALQFGQRLFEHGCEDDLNYEALVSAAHDMVAEAPDQAATFLAGLVAQDMLRVAGTARPVTEPGRN